MNHLLYETGRKPKAKFQVLGELPLPYIYTDALSLLLAISPGGGIGRRAGFKIRFLRECGFEAHPGYLQEWYFESFLINNSISLGFADEKISFDRLLPCMEGLE